MSDGRGPLTEPVLFRRIFLGLYALLVLGFFATIAVSGTYGAFFAPIAPVDAADGVETADDCRARLTALLDELESTGQSLMTRVHDEASESDWKAFSDRFRSRLQAIRLNCGLTTDPTQAELALLANHLERHRLGYETALRSLRQIAGPARAALMQQLRGEPPQNAEP